MFGNDSNMYVKKSELNGTNELTGEGKGVVSQDIVSNVGDIAN